MTMQLKNYVAGCAIAVLATAAHPVTAFAADDSVAAARDLYASAAYDDALKMLEQLLGQSHTREEGRAIGMYRILCLVAVGRGPDAERAIEALVQQEPLYRPAMDDLSPRMRTAFTEARKRLLPGIIQQQYRDAKAAFDRQEFAAAAASFSQVLEGLADPELADAAAVPPLSDLRTLAGGFQDLSAKAAAPPPPPPAPIVVEAPPPPPAAPVRDYRRLYMVGDDGIVPPTPIRQAFPRFAGRVLNAATGIIDVVIDATGNIESVKLRVGVDPRFDAQLIAAAERWQFKPATVDGVPVRFLKSVQINLAPEKP